MPWKECSVMDERLIATGLSSAAAVHDGARKELLFPWVSAPTSSGAPTIKESSY